MRSIQCQVVPEISDYLEWRAAAKRQGNLLDEHDRLFELMVRNSQGKKCLNICPIGHELEAPHGDWIQVVFSPSGKSMDNVLDEIWCDDETFAVIVCCGLESMRHPEKVIGEVWRMLSAGGEIWAELPLHRCCSSQSEDLWRASPDGLRVWMRRFDEVLCGSYMPSRSPFVNYSFFYGIKPSA
jgi:hypothetical protein